MLVRRKRVPALILCCCGILQAFDGKSGSVALSADPLMVESTLSMPNVLAGRPVAVWRYGVFLAIDQSGQLLDIIDREGRTARRIEFSIPGASFYRLRSGNVTRDPDGAILVAGSAATDSQHTSLIARLNPGSEEMAVIRTFPFVPYTIAAGPQGTMWAAGLEIGARERDDHEVIRRFDRSGRQLAPLLMRSSLPVRDTARFGHPAMHSYLVSSPDRVGWFSEAAGVYVEFSPDGREIGRYPAIEGAPAGAGIAMCDDGSVFAAGGLPSQPASKGLFSLDRSRGIWWFHPYPGTKSIILYGCDSQGLVVKSGAATVQVLRRPSAPVSDSK